MYGDFQLKRTLWSPWFIQQISIVRVNITKSFHHKNRRAINKCNHIAALESNTLSNIGSLEGTLEYYYHATPGGFSWSCMIIVLKGSFLNNLYCWVVSFSLKMKKILPFILARWSNECLFYRDNTSLWREEKYSSQACGGREPHRRG